MRLSQLGFNPGRIDGVFGPLLDAALRDFQHNCALSVDGTLTRRTLAELLRVAPTTGERALVHDVLDARSTPPSGPLLLWGNSDLLTAIEAASPLAVLEHDRVTAPVEEFAAHANATNACGVVAIRSTDEIDGVNLYYWSSYKTYSRQGERLASAVGAALANSGANVRLGVAGMALPVLRETKMTTLYIEHGALDASAATLIGQTIAGELESFFRG